MEPEDAEAPVTDEQARKTAALFKSSRKCMACKDNPVANSVLQELIIPGSGPAVPPFLGAILAIGKPEALGGAYDVRIRFVVNREDMRQDPVGIIYDGVKRALSCFYGPCDIRAKLDQQRNPQHPTLPLPRSSGGKRGGP